jgi:hypothetical protein
VTEQMLREVLHDAVAASPAPPSMSCAAMVRVARRARGRRRAGWSGASCAGVVAAVAATTLVLHGAPARSSGDFAAAFQDGAAPAAVRLLDTLLTVVPAGYAVRDTRQQAGVLQLQAVVTLSRNGGTGALVAEVHPAGNAETGTPCQVTELFRGMQGACEVMPVGTAQVGVVTRATGPDPSMDQWAGYRYPDGTVVYLAQSRQVDDGSPPLPNPPLVVEQLAALAADERFHVR